MEETTDTKEIICKKSSTSSLSPVEQDKSCDEKILEYNKPQAEEEKDCTSDSASSSCGEVKPNEAALENIGSKSENNDKEVKTLNLTNPSFPIEAEEKEAEPEGQEEPQKKHSESESASSYDPKNVHYEGDLAVYTDPNTNTQYEWNTETNKWGLREMAYELEGDTHVYTDKDGVKYFWDKEKSAWFPKVDDEFMAIYQMNYGFIDTAEEKKEENKEEPAPQPIIKPKGEKRKASEPTWFDVDQSENTKVYVNNLPSDITEEEFIELMSKCGLVMRDTSTGMYKIKLYKDAETGFLKGDALCAYIKVESVELALSLLDGYDYKGHKLKVERAKFQMKGEYDPKLKPKMKKRKEKMKLRKMQEKLFDWRPEKIVGDRAKHEKVVIVKNLFDPAIFDREVGLILEFQEDLREEVSKLGQVRKVIIYDRHPEGIAQINMSSPEEADEVVKLLNDRWYMKRQLKAEIWDGKTKFKIAETDAQINQRLQNWDKFLEDDNKNAAEASK